MSVLSFLHRNGLWLSWPLFVVGVGLLCFFITSAMRLGTKYRLQVLPLAAEQNVDFARSGRVMLWLEGPLLSSRLAGLSFELIGSDGARVKCRRPLARQRASSFSKVRFVEGVFNIPQAGRYVLRTSGLGPPQPADEDHNLVLMLPHLPQTVGCILGMILGAFLAIGSLVNFFLRLAGDGAGG